MENKLIIGSHVSFNKNDQLMASVKEAISYNSTTFMFYTGAPQNTNRSPIDDFKTVEAMDLMKENNMGYAAINHPVDRDPVCGYVGIIGDVCPGCGRKAGEGVSVEKVNDFKKNACC